MNERLRSGNLLVSPDSGRHRRRVRIVPVPFTDYKTFHRSLNNDGLSAAKEASVGLRRMEAQTYELEQPSSPMTNLDQALEHINPNGADVTVTQDTPQIKEDSLA